MDSANFGMDCRSTTSQYKDLMDAVFKRVQEGSHPMAYIEYNEVKQTNHINYLCIMRSFTQRIEEFLTSEKEYLSVDGVKYQYLIVLGVVLCDGESHDRTDEPLEDSTSLCLIMHTKKAGSNWKLFSCAHNTDKLTKLEQCLKKRTVDNDTDESTEALPQTSLNGDSASGVTETKKGPETWIPTMFLKVQLQKIAKRSTGKAKK